MSTPAPSDLLQRDREERSLSAAIERAAAGDGGVVLIEGPAGIGKTALLRQARALAMDAGLRVLSAVASELDRSFPYGLLHQLLELEVASLDDARRERLLSGAARHAEVVFDVSQSSSSEPGQAVLHGLYWLCANLADEQPLALLVDDLHWGDRASLRFLEYLARRLEGVPLVVVATTRVAEPGAQEDLLDRVRASPGAEQLALEPLAADAAAGLLAHWLGADPDPAFVEAALGATGGNPLLLHGLAREAAEADLTGSAADAARVEALTGTTVVAGVQRRLRDLGPDATTVAEACAVLGARRSVDDLGSVTELGGREVRVALDVLVKAGILLPDALEFAHPLVRSAVAAGTPPSRLAGFHTRAAARLAALGARPDELAVHLVAVPPADDPSVVATLREAARIAVSEGASETAVLHLRRALAEPPPAADRAMVLLELGELEQLTGAGEALARLADALGSGLTGDAAARAHAARAAQLLATDPRSALAALEQALASAQDPDLQLRLESGLLDSTVYLASLSDRRAEQLEAARATEAPSAAMLAHLAMESAYCGRPVDETLALVERALADGRVTRVLGLSSATFHLLVLTLRHAERPDLAEELLAEGERLLGSDASRMGAMRADHARTLWHLTFGSVASAEAFARAALAKVEGQGAPLMELSARVVVAEVLIEQDRLADVGEILAPIPDTPILDDIIVGPDFLAVRALARADQGRREEALADLGRAVAQIDRRGWKAPLKARAGLRLSGLLASSDPEQALAVAEREVASARGAQTPGALGAALRARARVQGGAEGIATLREAVGVLEPSPMRLERGWALHDLGSLIRREGSRSDAREPLRRALELAEQTEAPLLRRCALDELAASGARPRRSALSGVASLTPSERRVADLAASGKTNREIAEALWVTRKTVEVHLGKAYGKLGIRTRIELPDALKGAVSGE